MLKITAILPQRIPATLKKAHDDIKQAAAANWELDGGRLRPTIEAMSDEDCTGLVERIIRVAEELRDRVRS
jgi:hypothetical protein